MPLVHSPKIMKRPRCRDMSPMGGQVGWSDDHSAAGKQAKHMLDFNYVITLALCRGSRWGWYIMWRVCLKNKRKCSICICSTIEMCYSILCLLLCLFPSNSLIEVAGRGCPTIHFKNGHNVLLNFRLNGRVTESGRTDPKHYFKFNFHFSTIFAQNFELHFRGY